MLATTLDRDYVSPGLSAVVPDAHFPHLRRGDRASHPWRYLRREVPHHWYVDERFPLMGFINRDEAAILYSIALQFAGQPALEIGSWLGWSTCHLALAGVQLDVLDPAHADPDLCASVEASLRSCGVAERVHLTGAASPDGVHALAARRRVPWQLFFIDGDHEAPAPQRDALACLPYAAADCAFVFHDLASPAVADGLRVLEGEGFQVLVYQTAQLMGLAWRGRVQPVAHQPDPDVVWQVPQHLLGLPIAGVTAAVAVPGAAPAPATTTPTHPPAAPAPPAGRYRQLRDCLHGTAAAGQARPSVCIVTNELIGPFKNGGIGTAMTGLAEQLAQTGCRVTVVYTGAIWSPDAPLGAWQQRYARLGIDVVALSIESLAAFDGPLRQSGFGVPHLLYEELARRDFDVIHFNDCLGEGSLCLAAKRLGLAFQDTLLVVALHSPSQWVLELNQTLPSSIILAAFNAAERLSVAGADLLWSPSRYLLDWVVQRGFELPAATVVQQYRIPTRQFGPRATAASLRAATTTTAAARTTTRPTEVVFFGRLEGRKGLPLFCNAIHLLRDELAARGVRVTFLGKPSAAHGHDSLALIARYAADWRFPVTTLTDLGQAEALEYLLGGDRLAVIASPADNSPCTVYEVVLCGIPFLAARSGGIPELISAADQARVLFEATTEGLSRALRGALDQGAPIAAPAISQTDVQHTWSAFHAEWRTHLPPPPAPNGTPAAVVVVDGAAPEAIANTLASLAGLPNVRRVIVLNRGPQSPLIDTGWPLRIIDLTMEDAERVLEALADLTDEVVFLLHAGVRLQTDAAVRLLGTMGRTLAVEVEVDGLQPAAQVPTEHGPRPVPALGGDPTFALFEGPTWTGGLVVRAAAVRRACLGRRPLADSPFAGLADFCLTCGLRIWPYPEAVFDLPPGWQVAPARSSAARLRLYAECSTTDRYYMLAASYGASTALQQAAGQKRRIALNLVDLGLIGVVRLVAHARRVPLRVRRRLGLGRARRRLRRLLDGRRR